MSGHTPGPWMVKRHITKFELFSDDEMVAWITPSLLPEDAANLSLIAAAPELLEALEQAVTSMQDYGYLNSHPAVFAARAAIAKATGGAA